MIEGEEVHLPPIKGFTVAPHTINFGGEYSINSLVEDEAVSEVGKDKSVRSIREDCPEVMSREEFEDKMTELAKKKLTFPKLLIRLLPQRSSGHTMKSGMLTDLRF